MRSRFGFTTAYDGRGFLSEWRSHELPQGQRHSTNPTYSSAGLLLHRNTVHAAPFGVGGSNSDLYVFYFAGRPVATLENLTTTSTSTSTLRFLTTDHLGTPILMTSTSGSQVWQGGFEPFGADYSSAPTLLRLPGQWYDPLWSTDLGVYYNVNRWYDAGTGIYTQPGSARSRSQPEPLRLRGGQSRSWASIHSGFSASSLQNGETASLELSAFQ